MSKIFGIGWAKTGTTTLGQCFEILGYDHQGQRLDLVHDIKEGDLRQVREVARQSESFEDWPWIVLFRELDAMFPESKFILTKRKPEGWIRSYKNMLETESEASDELNEIRRVLYDLPFPDVTEEQLLRRYKHHNWEVEEYFSHRPDDLLIVNWREGDGWEELCSFLGHDVPSHPFPHANKGDYSYMNQVRSYARRILKQIGD
jgi:hypothetical protein